MKELVLAGSLIAGTLITTASFAAPSDGLVLGLGLGSTSTTTTATASGGGHSPKHLKTKKVVLLNCH